MGLNYESRDERVQKFIRNGGRGCKNGGGAVEEFSEHQEAVGSCCRALEDATPSILATVQCFRPTEIGEE